MAKKNFLNEMAGRIERLARKLVSMQTSRFERAFRENIKDAEVKRTPTGIEISKESEDSGSSVIDMKPGFRKSSKTKTTKNGGWYLVVPIRRYTSRNKETRESASGMSSRLYKELNRFPSGGTQTIVSDYLYDNRKENFSPVSELNYTPKSNNITKMENPRGRGNLYVSFRTVSNKSAPNSWLLNRESENPDSLSEEAKRIISEVRSMEF